MTGSKFVKLALITAATSLSACSTVKMPNLDFFKSSAFEEEAKNIGDYPDVTDAPAAPTNVRPARTWDTQAKLLMAKRDAFDTPRPVDPTRTETEISRDTDALKARARAYKADDPQ